MMGSSSALKYGDDTEPVKGTLTTEEAIARAQKEYGEGAVVEGFSNKSEEIIDLMKLKEGDDFAEKKKKSEVYLESLRQTAQQTGTDKAIADWKAAVAAWNNVYPNQHTKGKSTWSLHGAGEDKDTMHARNTEEGAPTDDNMLYQSGLNPRRNR